MYRAVSLLLSSFLLLSCVEEGRPQTATTSRDASAPAPDNSNLVGRLLTAHNAVRDDKRLPRLAWNARLADDAASWARVIASDGNMRHSPQEGRPNQGENLWIGTAGFYSLEHMMKRFTDEKSDFRPGIFPDVSATRDWRDVAHYTQMIWPETREVGCALVTANGRDALVCRYFPAGNIVGQKIG